ncbi:MULTISPECIES: DNA-binding protein [unclassified Sporosarcina]|uniref:DNA-binding protein n=1 Tax=unclassified Sporosarcina TaxID=2647733 RepID=UPI000C165E44|nr:MULTISPECIES: DNA-binding protein [unclassified Sporosarcina]PID01564.1 DNA-binding protein [Sporosarcina sp. P2]PID25470.1 DNA-binding protein [Sporosarcina sp. P7]
MEFDLIWIGLGIAAAGYFVGDGLKNFKNPNAKDSISEIFSDDDEHELIRENNVHYFMGISKEDAKHLIQEYPNIPRVVINNKIYYPKAKLRKWLSDIGA